MIAAGCSPARGRSWKANKRLSVGGPHKSGARTRRRAGALCTAGQLFGRLEGLATEAARIPCSRPGRSSTEWPAINLAKLAVSLLCGRRNSSPRSWELASQLACLSCSLLLEPSRKRAAFQLWADPKVCPHGGPSMRPIAWGRSPRLAGRAGGQLWAKTRKSDTHRRADTSAAHVTRPPRAQLAARRRGSGPEVAGAF